MPNGANTGREALFGHVVQALIFGTVVLHNWLFNTIAASAFIIADSNKRRIPSRTDTAEASRNQSNSTS
ncbi:hypothetical protein M405DRAFT_928527 [Rhizopogon salebrosus TDB-379]|nr:hypothetical protein M405DRAFT_928527 [Rhizopogon salebrosus TDB-379]